MVTIKNPIQEKKLYPMEMALKHPAGLSDSQLFDCFREEQRKDALKYLERNPVKLEKNSSLKYSGVTITRFHDQVDYWK